MKKTIIILICLLNAASVVSQDIYTDKLTLGQGTAGKWFKLATFSVGCTWNSASIDFDIDYVDTQTAMHIDGIIRFRNSSYTYIAKWFYYQYGHLNDGIKLKDLGAGNYELWILARGNHAHIMTGLEVNRECAITTSILNTKIEIADPEAYSDVSFFGNFNMPNNKLAIGSNSPDQSLTVDGAIHAKEVKVDLNIPGPDYVFEKDYKLRTLEETLAFIKENKHLPEIPSAKEMEANGLDLGDMNMRLLKKIEELTLYQIQLMEELKSMKKQLQELKQ